MAYFENREELERRLKTYDETLSELFNQIEETTELKQNLDRVKEYYRLSFTRATNINNADSIVASYQLFVSNLTQVRDGILTTEDALALIKETTSSRELGIIFHNIAKVCELIFLALATLTCCCALITVGIPLIFTQPPIGIAITLGTSLLMFATANAFTDCFDEFKTSDRLRDEDKRERNLVSFFKPAETTTPVVSQVEEPRPGRLYPDLSAVMNQ